MRLQRSSQSSAVRATECDRASHYTSICGLQAEEIRSRGRAILNSGVRAFDQTAALLYNAVRSHQSLEYRTPDEVYFAALGESTAVAA
jgi:hypothetical protein